MTKDDNYVCETLSYDTTTYDICYDKPLKEYSVFMPLHGGMGKASTRREAVRLAREDASRRAEKKTGTHIEGTGIYYWRDDAADTFEAMDHFTYYHGHGSTLEEAIAMIREKSSRAYADA